VAYAKGKYALGLCDYCGQRFKLNELKKNWRGFKVCEADYEPKEPQLKPLRYRGDAIALFEPRPDRIESMDVFLGAPGDSAFQSIGSANNRNDLRPYPVTPNPTGTARLGQVLVSITNPPEEVLDGVSATAAVGQVEVDANSLIFTPTGIASSTDIGQVDTFTTQFVTVTAGSVVGQGQAGQAQGEGNSIFVFPESQEISGQVSPVIVVQDEDALPSGVEGVGESGAVSAVPGVEAQVIGVSSTVSDGDADIIGDASVISTGVAGAGTTGSVG
jgi:hypothetical protein